ncbi:MAG: hypothetical protein JXB10_13080 [Pirellulales bacterium]|nr:hypothetical protein [Pirellulales bacterium]
MARWILIATGILWLGINGALFTQIESDAQRLVQEKVAEFEKSGIPYDPDSPAQYQATLTRHFTIVLGGSAALGIALIVFGVFVKFFPVPCTVSGLLLCIIATVAYYRYSPEMTTWNWTWKIFTILALLLAIYAVLASPKAQKPPQKRAIFIPR